MRALLLLLLLPLLSAAAELMVTLPEQATVASTQIVLGEIASVQGDEEIVARLNAIVLAPAPIPGQRFSLTPGMVRVKLRQFGIAPDDVMLTCPDAVEITRKSLTVTGASLVEAAKTWLAANLASATGEELSLVALTHPADLQTVHGPLAITCSAGAGIGALRSVQVVATVNEMDVWRGSISFRLRRYAEVLVVKRPLAARQAITASCVARERREIPSGSDLPLTDPSALTRARTTHALRVGDILTAAMLEMIPVVERNQAVTVLARCGSMIIRLRAVACENGGVGEVIILRNPESRREFSARVLPSGELELCE